MTRPPSLEAACPHPLIGLGLVRHTRLRPAANAFNYRVFFLLLPMRTLGRDPTALQIPRNQRGLLSFFDTDHGEGSGDCLAWIERLLATEGVDGIDGEIWLQTFPRVLGFVFNPVSFWYCHRADGALAAVVAEVNNTFGERHCYLLLPDAPRRSLRWGEQMRATKVFHVSPFCKTEGGYRFRFLRTAASTPTLPRERIVARIDHDDNAGPLLLTSLSGELEPLTKISARRAFLSHPMHSFGVVVRIHWQALKLWGKRVPFVAKPTPPHEHVTR